MPVPVFYHKDLKQNLFFLAIFKPIILQFFTLLQEKLHSFNIHAGRSTHALPLSKKIVELTTL